MKVATLRTILSAVLIAAVFSLSAFATEGDTLWTRTYGGIHSELVYAITPSGDGGFLLAGRTNSFGAGYSDMWLVKVNAQGDSLWSRTYGGSSYDYAHAIIPSGDGGFLLAGETSSFGAGYYDMWLVKVNAQGDSLWSRTYGGSSYEQAHAIIPSGDGGFLLAGTTGSFGTGYYNMWLVKINAQGDSLWSRTYGGNEWDKAYSIIPSGDGNFLLTGMTRSFGAGSEDMWLVKVSAQGDSLWSHTYGGNSSDWANSIIPFGDGGFLLAGKTSSFGAGYYDMWLVKVNAQGDSLWSRTFGGNDVDQANSIISSGDGGFLLAGRTISFGAGSIDMWLVKVNAQGDSLWSRTYGGSDWDEASSIIPSGDGGFLLAGQTGSFGAGSFDMWLVKIEGPSISPVNISLDPINPPITIPASGGSFNFNVTVANNVTTPQNTDAWIMTQLPSGSWYGPLLGPINLTLPASTSISRLRTQTIPGIAPAGAYWYEGRVGDYPATISDTSGFGFTKLGFGIQSASGGSGFGEWTNTGEEFDVGARHAVPVSGSGATPTMVISPNPFNPSTAISYQLPAASRVSLRVYDTAGRLVETLVDSWQEAGEYRATFDGSRLAAGVYVYRLVTSGPGTTPTTVSGKMVLLK